MELKGKLWGTGCLHSFDPRHSSLVKQKILDEALAVDLVICSPNYKWLHSLVKQIHTLSPGMHSEASIQLFGAATSSLMCSCKECLAAPFGAEYYPVVMATLQLIWNWLCFVLGWKPSEIRLISTVQRF